MDSIQHPASLSAPITQQLLDCSNTQARINGFLVLNTYMDRAPEALLFHDAAGLATASYLTQVARAVDQVIPGSTRITARSLAEDGHAPVYHDVPFDGRVARLGSARDADDVARRLGHSASEVASLDRTASMLYAAWLPAFPDPHQIAADDPQLRLIPVNDSERHISGMLVYSPADNAGVLVHDHDPLGNTQSLNRFLSVAVGVVAETLGHAGASAKLAECSVLDRDDGYCMINRTQANQSALPACSGRSLALGDIVADDFMRSTDIARLARTLDHVRDSHCWQSCFGSARTLDVSGARKAVDAVRSVA